MQLQAFYEGEMGVSLGKVVDGTTEVSPGRSWGAFTENR
jgi:hypothetical protein